MQFLPPLGHREGLAFPDEPCHANGMGKLLRGLFGLVSITVSEPPVIGGWALVKALRRSRRV